MRIKRLIASLALCLALPVVAFASEGSEKAAASFDRGLTVLSQGDFDSALAAFTEAAKSDPENQNYRQHVALVSRVKQVRGMLDKEQDPQKWAQIAKSLRSFYSDFDVYGEALKLDTKRHTKLCTPETGVDLAESQLELGRNAEAVKVLASLGAKTPPRGKLLNGIALARMGDLEAAKKIAKESGVPVTEDLQQVFDAACLNALVGNTAMAADQLTLVFEKTPAGRLDRVKAYAKQRADLAKLKGAEFEKVWAVASKVESSGCAGCSGAAGCSKKSAGGCGSDSGGCESGASGEKKEGESCDKDK